jgi:hypothetical protein
MTGIGVEKCLLLRRKTSRSTANVRGEPLYEVRKPSESGNERVE